MKPTILVPHGAEVPTTWRRTGENLPWNSTLDLRSYYSPGNDNERKPNVVAYEGQTGVGGGYAPILILGDGNIDKDEMSEIAERVAEKRRRNAWTKGDLEERTLRWRQSISDLLTKAVEDGKRNWRTAPLKDKYSKKYEPRGGIFQVAK